MDDENLPEIFVCKRIVTIEEKDRYETCAKKIENMPQKYTDDYKSELQNIEPIGWMFTYPSDMGNEPMSLPDDKAFIEVLNYTLKALDPAIIRVDRSNEVKDEGIRQVISVTDAEFMSLVADGEIDDGYTLGAYLLKDGANVAESSHSD